MLQSLFAKANYPALLKLGAVLRSEGSGVRDHASGNDGVCGDEESFLHEFVYVMRPTFFFFRESVS